MTDRVSHSVLLRGIAWNRVERVGIRYRRIECELWYDIPHIQLEIHSMIRS